MTEIILSFTVVILLYFIYKRITKPPKNELERILYERELNPKKYEFELIDGEYSLIFFNHEDKPSEFIYFILREYLKYDEETIRKIFLILKMNGNIKVGNLSKQSATTLKFIAKNLAEPTSFRNIKIEIL